MNKNANSTSLADRVAYFQQGLREHDGDALDLTAVQELIHSWVFTIYHR